MSKTITSEELAILKSLIRKVSTSGSTLEEVLLLSDFSATLEHQLEHQLRTAYPEVLLTNPTTGKTAVAVSHVLRVLAFGYVANWRTAVKNKVKALEEGGAFEYKFSDYKHATICVDVDRVEELIPLLFPRKGPAQLKWFRKKHSIS